MTEYRIDPAGTLQVMEDGLYLAFLARCPLGKPVHLELKTKNGTYPLGVPIPDGEEMTLRRRISRAALSGLGDITGCRAAGTRNASVSEDWEPVSHPESLFSDPVLRSLGGTEGAMCRRDEDGLLLAIPYDPHAPFPLLPVFCLVSPCRLVSGEYLLLRIRDGLPVPGQTE